MQHSKLILSVNVDNDGWELLGITKFVLGASEASFGKHTTM
jgi:hypothetical protein